MAADFELQISAMATYPTEIALTGIGAARSIEAPVWRAVSPSSSSLSAALPWAAR